MAPVTTVELETASTGWHIELIMRNEDLLRRYLKVLRRQAHGFTAVVHVRVRNH